MSLKTLLRAGSIGALAAALSMSFPAIAQDDERPRDRGDERVSGDEDIQRHHRASVSRAQAMQARQERAESRQEARAARAAAPSYQAPAAQERAGRDWNRANRRAERAAERSGGDWNRRDNTNNDWGQARAARAQAEAQARAQARAQAHGDVRAGGWDSRRSGDGNWERNRSYRDENRSTTYRDGYRDGRRADNWRDQRQTDNAYRSGYRDGYRTDHYRNGHRSWSRDWRRDNRYNWYNYRASNRHLYSLGRYYSPYRGHRYSRLSIGFHLGRSFFGNRYWINDPWQYRLPAAYGPYRWVRYYDDALLVDIYSGQVVDVIYDFFW